MSKKHAWSELRNDELVKALKKVAKARDCDHDDMGLEARAAMWIETLQTALIDVCDYVERHHSQKHRNGHPAILKMYKTLDKYEG